MIIISIIIIMIIDITTDTGLILYSYLYGYCDHGCRCGVGRMGSCQSQMRSASWQDVDDWMTMACMREEFYLHITTRMKIFMTVLCQGQPDFDRMQVLRTCL